MPRGRPRKQVAAAGGGLDGLVYEIGHKLGQAFGAALVSGVKDGVERSGGIAAVGQPAARIGGGKRRVGRPARMEAGAACHVPGCSRRGVAKGLCATHYRKARRLKLGASLSPAQLSELAQDGRKTRFSGKKAE